MSQRQNEDDSTREPEDVETQLESGHIEEDEDVVHKMKKPEKKAVVMRDPGKTLFPMSRVQKIIKADKVHKNTSFIRMTAKLHYNRKYQLSQRMLLS